MEDDEQFRDNAARLIPSRAQRDVAAIPQRVDQLEDAVMNLAKLYEALKKRLDG